MNAALASAAAEWNSNLPLRAMSAVQRLNFHWGEEIDAMSEINVTIEGAPRSQSRSLFYVPCQRLAHHDWQMRTAGQDTLADQFQCRQSISLCFDRGVFKCVGKR